MGHSSILAFGKPVPKHFFMQRLSPLPVKLHSWNVFSICC
jgi:hypothetical protein